ncbi:pseudouridylate synthase PUS7L [Lampris incognitus]|uniref:pseudouridylate synthase PUS7L n=1 Tax=Lampris incognitus TaxID=2546036 RepID=UPI0024B4B506|nr:pseudouridylate synthase PUS7L [Lampris incognitus]
MKGDCDVVNVPICFISNHEGFDGSIKNFTRDFVVTELDINGLLVTKPTAILDVFPRISNAISPCTGRNREPVPEFKSNSISATQDTDVPVDDKSRDVTSPSLDNFDLKVILGQLVSEELEQFVVTLKDESGLRGDEVEKLVNQDLSLGSFPDKHHRACVHRAVRHNFPFLMTVTIQPEIRVRGDPDYRELSRLVTEMEAEDFFRFINAKEQGSSYTFRPDHDKEHRTAVHHFLSRRFGKLVETKSFCEQGETAISVRLRERGRPKKRKAEDCKKEEVYTAFTLCKENLETLEAISYMAATLGVLPSDFTYCGIKDKRAITYQSMVVKKVSPQRLKEKTAEFEKRGMRLSHVRSVSEPLRLGQLQGNHFDLVVRDLRPHKASDTHPSGPDTPSHLAVLVQQAVENVKARGFVNYYGPQRFGTGQNVRSDQVGLALLKEDMVSAVHLFFTPEEGDDPQSRAKRHFLQTGDAKESLALMPLSKARERLMLRALHRYGTGADGCAQAWLSLPHGMRVFSLHAYCSRVWNEAVAHRLSSLGHLVRQGDLVWVQDHQGGTVDSNLPQIHVVTSEEEKDGVYTLEQVVLPMPGNTVRYPGNAMGTWYKERLASDGLENCPFRVSALKLNLPGCYRPLLACPRNLTYRLQGPTTGDGGREGGAASYSGEAKSEEKPNCTSSKMKQDADSLTLTLNFDLESSCYATVCLREIMKCDP